MTFIMSVRDYQIRCNSLALPNSTTLVVDGMNGPNTRKQIDLALKTLGLKDKTQLFHPSGITRVQLHWTASTYNVTDEVRSHYNGVFDKDGNEYDGGSPAIQQASYDWRNKVGVSHTLSANTGAIGLAVAAMGNATVDWSKGVVDQGKYPLTWEGIDAMLKKTAEYCKYFDIAISPWTVLTHAEVHNTLGIRQNGKWDFMCLPDEPKKLINPRICGDILRNRMKEKFCLIT